MNCKIKRIWTLTAFLAEAFIPVDVQFAMPMCVPPMLPPMAQPMFPMPAPMPIIGPPLCPLPIQQQFMTRKPMTSTTTTERPINPDRFAIAIPVPVPMPVPMAIPAFAPSNLCQGPPPRPKNCPPCPPCICKPSCTPSFYSYCSPCHLKCRCKNQNDTPKPLPHDRPALGPAYGMPVQIPPIMGPPPIVIVPYPPPLQIPIRKQRRRPIKKTKYHTSSCSEESTESSSSESSYVRKIRRGKRKRMRNLRRSLRSSESENDLVKPMLSYIAENGDVKFKTKINSDDVAELLGENEAVDKHQTVQVITRENRKSGPEVIVLSKDDGKQRRERYKKVFLRSGVSNHVLDSGKKELIFKPTGNQKISNLSVSFQIS